MEKKTGIFVARRAFDSRCRFARGPASADGEVLFFSFSIAWITTGPRRALVLAY
jgi:hypothetical protein